MKLAIQWHSVFFVQMKDQLNSHIIFGKYGKRNTIDLRKDEFLKNSPNTKL